MTQIRTNTSNFLASKKIDNELVIKLHKVLNSIKGITNIEVLQKQLCIEYNDQLIDENYIKRTLENIKFPFEKPDHRKGFFRRIIDKLANDNKKEFGSKGPNCCS